MLRRLFAVAFLTIALLPVPTIAAHVKSATTAASTSLAMFDTEAAAQVHCPGDVVVSLNTESGISHEKGMRWYGRTKHGAFVCGKEADAAGDRDTRNGQ